MIDDFPSLNIIGNTLRVIAYPTFPTEGFCFIEVQLDTNRFLRFETEELLIPQAAKHRAEAYSITVSEVKGFSAEVRTQIVGEEIRGIQKIIRSEWLGSPVFKDAGIIGNDPQEIIWGKMDAVPVAADAITTTCGVIIQTTSRRILIHTIAFPENLGLTMNDDEIDEFRQAYT